MRILKILMASLFNLFCCCCLVLRIDPRRTPRFFLRQGLPELPRLAWTWQSSWRSCRVACATASSTWIFYSNNCFPTLQMNLLRREAWSLDRLDWLSLVMDHLLLGEDQDSSSPVVCGLRELCFGKAWEKPAFLLLSHGTLPDGDRWLLFHICVFFKGSRVMKKHVWESDFHLHVSQLDRV